MISILATPLLVLLTRFNGAKDPGKEVAMPAWAVPPPVAATTAVAVGCQLGGQV